jgi:hypothetical protein
MQAIIDNVNCMLPIIGKQRVTDIKM